MVKKAAGINISDKNGLRVVEGLGYYKPNEINDLRDVIKDSTIKYGNLIGFKFKDKNGIITGRTYAQFDKDIDYLGTALISLGLKGTHISIISENRYEWGVCYFSVVNGTGVVVPLDKYLPQNEVENLIIRGKVDAVFYSPAYHNMMMTIAKSNNRVKYYICMESISAEGDSRFLTLPDLIKKGKVLFENGNRSFTNAPIDRSNMSILLFTSGTTNLSKGVMLSHSNIVSNIKAISSVIHAGPGDVHLSLLPLHHTFENTAGLIYMVYRGVCIAYCDGIRYIAQNLKEYNVTLLVAVPAILEAIYRRMREGIKKSGKEKIFNMMVKISDALRTAGIDIRRKLFRSVFEQIGPGLRLAVSGAAPLDPDVVIGFEKIGLYLLQGYGLTETSPVICANNDFASKPGTVGHPLGGIEVAIDSPDENGMGEIITRGGNVMLGYYEDPDTTAQVMYKDGWFRTGDLGIVDDNGFLKITGRAKTMIVFTNGKKAFPEEYEVLLNNIPGVKDSFVWGNRAFDGGIQVCAKIVVDKENLPALTEDTHSKFADDTTLETKLAAYFNNAIKEINKNVPQYKIIRYFVMTYEDLIKTTTLKIKRHIEYENTMKVLDKSGLGMRKASGLLIDELKYR